MLKKKKREISERIENMKNLKLYLFNWFKYFFIGYFYFFGNIFEKFLNFFDRFVVKREGILE